MKTAFAAVLLASALYSQEPGKPGTRVDALPVADMNGQPAMVRTAGKITAVIFISAQCPVSNAYNERMQALYEKYKDQVEFVFINSNATEPVSDVVRHAREHGFTFRVWRDPGNRAADLLNAQFTPETYVIDREGLLRYHGRIDDSRDVAGVKVQNFALALDAVLAGKSVEAPEVKAFGCSIKRGKAST